ncbi:DUF5623 domain-containing protein [Pedobacter gandavensis]|uniref:DUF5623 domain-containing protein n=1 Tax=Pedobacter gandavensis TaxID=2679963 RepID=A0ABR6EUR2_9SPHI|nr:DUF5623 domain-containing protein [Pedobacter gandavensis]MBB2148975.1 hypothetical protein [Pedobacter gandavensis]
MKIKATGHSATFFKRKAKTLKKELGVSHTEALNLLAKEQGCVDWDSFVKKTKPTQRPKVAIRRPKTPVPEILNYHNFMTGAIIGQHPNTKMTVRNHAQVGDLLQVLLDATEYHKRAKNHLQEIHSVLDTWLGCEYSEEQLANAEFNEIYYGKTTLLPCETKPSLSRQAELKRFLRNAKAIIDQSYHDCKPLEKLHQRFQQAAKALENWPVKVPGANRLKGRVPVGTFVRLGRTKKIGIVFNHDIQRQTVEGYSDGGRFVYGRHEVSVLRKQLDIADFKPMRLYLPYGKWKCADGREVLFNRDYCPIWDRSSDGVVMPIDPDIYVPHDDSEFYFHDGTAPYHNNNITVKNCLSVLNDWGVAEINSRVLELVPIALANRDFGLLNPKVIS